MEVLRANSGLAFLGRATMDPLRSILPVLQLPQRATATPGACLALPFLQDAILPEQLDLLKPSDREKIKNESAPSRPVRSRLGGRLAMPHIRHLLVAGLFVLRVSNHDHDYSRSTPGTPQAPQGGGLCRFVRQETMGMRCRPPMRCYCKAQYGPLKW